MNLPWFIKYEDRYKADLESLVKLDIAFQIDKAEKEKGVLILTLVIVKDNKLNLRVESDLSLIVEFPDSYPFFRPEVFATNLSLPRHQNPIAKNLCLLPRPSQFWDVSKALGDYLQDQLPKVIVKGSIIDQDAIAEDENEQAEPISEYYSSLRNIVIACDVPDDASDIPTISSSQEIIQQGSFVFTHPEPNPRFEFGLPTDEQNILRFFVRDWLTSDHGPLPGMALPTFATGSSPRKGAWFKISSLGTVDDNFYDLVLEETKKVVKKPDPIKFKSGSITYITGITFPEETSKGLVRWGWLFIVYGTHFQRLKSNSGIKKIPKPFKLTVGATRIGKKDYLSRIPKLGGFENHTISVVGLGSLGAPSVIEFAKNGIEKLRILDYDKVEPTSCVRWPLGFKYMGLYKAIALKHFISEQFPYTTVAPIIHRLGGARTMNHSKRPEHEVIDDLMQNASIVYDASAEEGVNHLLSEEAKRRKIPYISLEARRGAWGGLIFRTIPGSGRACWMCMQHILASGEIPGPPQDKNGGVQPRGCGDLTFTGASFDLQNISLAGVRLAVSTLCNSEGKYGDVEWNLAILELVNQEGRQMIPTWRTYNLDIHGNCPYCNHAHSLVEEETSNQNHQGCISLLS